MDLKEILSIVLLILALGSLVTLLFITVIPTSKKELEERSVRIKCLKELTKYLENKNKCNIL